MFPKNGNYDAVRMEQRALITHNLLYNGPITISDSDFINNTILRLAFRDDDWFYRGLLEQGMLSLAVRAINGNILSLSEIASDMLTRPGHSMDLDTDSYQRGEELALVEEKGQILGYPLDDAAPRFAQKLLKLFKQNKVAGLSDGVVEYLVHACEMADNAGKLSWGWFSAESPFWIDFAEQFALSDSKLAGLKSTISNVARGPYITFLPESLGLMPSYSTEDRFAMEVYRGRYGQKEQELENVTLRRPRIDLGDFVAGLAKLSINDIVTLFNSSEASAFRNSCNDLSIAKIDIQQASYCLCAYRERIESMVCERLARGRSRDLVSEKYSFVLGAETPLESSQEEPIWESFLRFSAELTADVAFFHVGSALMFSYEIVQRLRGRSKVQTAVQQTHRQSQELAKAEEVAKEVAIGEMIRSKQKQVDFTILADRPYSRDFCAGTGPAKQNFP
jgi:hypothetical protein